MIMGHKRQCVLLFVFMCLSVEGRQTKSRDRIVGGDVVRPNSLFYQVSLQVRTLYSYLFQNREIVICAAQ